MQTSRQFTLLACGNLTVEAALASPRAQIVGTTILNGLRDEVLEWLPHHPDLIAIDHEDGSLYGDVPGERYRVGPLGTLTGRLGYAALDRQLRHSRRVSLAFGRGHRDIVARCLRAATRQRLDAVLTTLGTATPLNLDHGQVICLLIEALTVVSERHQAVSEGRLAETERLGILTILPDLTPRPLAA